MPPKKIKKTQKRKISPVENNSSRIISSVIFGTIVGLVSTLVLTVIGTLICYSSSDPDAFISKTAFGTLYISSFITGLAATLKNRSSALLCGGLSGVVTALLFAFLSIFLKNDATVSPSFPMSLLIRLSTIATSMLGGYIALAVKRSSYKHKKR